MVLRQKSVLLKNDPHATIQNKRFFPPCFGMNKEVCKYSTLLICESFVPWLSMSGVFANTTDLTTLSSQQQYLHCQSFVRSYIKKIAICCSLTEKLPYIKKLITRATPGRSLVYPNLKKDWLREKKQALPVLAESIEQSRSIVQTDSPSSLL